jgi:dihydrofolate reductase
MKVTMVMISSADGKTTQGNNPNVYLWTSPEDQKFFFSLIKKNNLIVMGRETYEASKKVIKLEEKKLRIVLTRNQKKYLKESINGQLEFSNNSPENLIKRMSGLGYKKMLLVGGGTINGLFLKQNLVDEFYLTVEPKIFGTGKDIVAGQLLNTKLQLVSIKKLNKIGTILLRYTVIPVKTGIQKYGFPPSRE